jgi:hypothetical protein
MDCLIELYVSMREWRYSQLSVRPVYEDDEEETRRGIWGAFTTFPLQHSSTVVLTRKSRANEVTQRWKSGVRAMLPHTYYLFPVQF